MDLPDGWEHKSGYHLNACGKAIKYHHPESGKEAYVEAMLMEGEDELVYRPTIFTSDGVMMEHPPVKRDVDSAKEWLREKMAEHA